MNNFSYNRDLEFDSDTGQKRDTFSRRVNKRCLHMQSKTEHLQTSEPEQAFELETSYPESILRLGD